MRYEDLPARMRDQVDAKLDAQNAEKRSRPSRASARGAMTARCECGDTFTTENQLNKHPAGPGHRRVDTINVDTT